MSRFLVALSVVLATAVSGCGGPDIAYTEVTSDPAGLPIPDGAIVTDTAGTQTTTGRSGRERSRDTAESDDPATTTTDETTTTVPPAVTEVPTAAPVVPETPAVTEETVPEEDTGAAAPPTEEPAVPEDTGGGAAAPTDQFCADNPGACSN